jgi:hypothetical protein
MLGIEIPSGSSASIGIDSSVTSNEDYEITSPSIANSTLSGTKVSINSSLKYKLMVRALIVKTSVISSFRAYPSSGTYAITATLSNTLIPGTPITVTKNVTIIQGITNLTITSPPMCERNVPCTLSSYVATGSSIKYNWSFVDANETTSATSLSYIFTTFGVRLQYLVASCSTLISASIVGQQAYFSFAIQTGRDYTCLIDFGDTQKLMIDHTTVLNGSSVGHNYTYSEGVYTVVITCSNFLSSQTYQVQHHVQYEITNIQLLAKGALRNIPYYVKFGLGTGTNAQVTFTFNDVLDNEMTYVESTKVGTSSQRNAELSAIYPVKITASNYVSDAIVNDFFQISAPIENPSLTITPVNKSTNIYNFKSQINFSIDMTLGSNVLIVLYIGDEIVLSTLPSNQSVIGDWKNPVSFSKKYKYPNTYTVTAYVSNAINSFNLSKEILVMSEVHGLIAELQSSPVLYLSSLAAGRAFFQFKYLGNDCSGSHANVSIASGSGSNTVLGDFWLGMDFVQNISKTPLFFDYKNPGSYDVTFDIRNEISSTIIVLPITVSPVLDGVYVYIVPPNVYPGMFFQMQVYIQQGENVSLQWIVDGVSLGVFPRMCKNILYLVFSF